MLDWLLIGIYAGINAFFLCINCLVRRFCLPRELREEIHELRERLIALEKLAPQQQN
jgi:hypothetical protein